MAACCFTGHRPTKLPWGYDTRHPAFRAFYRCLNEALEDMVDQGCDTFYSGMALGVDLWAARAVLEARQRHTHIRLAAVIPCPNQADRWQAQHRQEYREILAQADQQVLIRPHYTPGCMHERNRYMVEHSSHIIAVYDGHSRGGTRYTLDLARSKGLVICHIDPYTALGYMGDAPFC